MNSWTQWTRIRGNSSKYYTFILGHELGRMTRVLFDEVWPHNSAPPATALAENTGEDPVQAGSPSHLDDELQSTADFEVQRHLWSISSLSWLSVIHGYPPLVIGPSLLPLHVLGTVCPNMPRPHPVCFPRSGGYLKAFLFRCSFPWFSPQFLVPAQWQLPFSDI